MPPVASASAVVCGTVVGQDATDDGSDQWAVLGREMAEARAVEEQHVLPSSSPLAGVDYPEAAADLWRWADCPQDAVMSAFVDSYAAADARARAVLRASMTMDDLYTVLLFAKRRAFAAIRTGDTGAVVDAMDAISTIDIDRVDWRDVSMAAMLAAYSAARSGMTVVTAAAGAIRRSTRPVAEILSDVAGRGEIDLPEACGYREIATAGGPILVEDGYAPYQPDRDLIDVALSVASAIEVDGTYQVTAVGLAADLPPVWVGANTGTPAAVAIDNLTGCTSIHATPRASHAPNPSEHFLLAYIGEAATAADAAMIADAANHSSRPGSVVAGIALERLCAVLVAASAMAGKPSVEDSQTLARFAPAITALLS
jgi:hypothetical protein